MTVTNEMIEAALVAFYGHQDDVPWSAAIREDMKRALSAAPQAVVKPLEWEEWREDGRYLHARSGDREYLLNITSDGRTWSGATRPYAYGVNLSDEQTRATAAEAREQTLREALEPFSRFAGLLFERNFNNADPVDTMTASDGGQATLLAGDFFRARAVMKGGA